MKPANSIKVCLIYGRFPIRANFCPDKNLYRLNKNKTPAFMKVLAGVVKVMYRFIICGGNYKSINLLVSDIIIYSNKKKITQKGELAVN